MNTTDEQTHYDLEFIKNISDKLSSIGHDNNNNNNRVIRLSCLKIDNKMLEFIANYIEKYSLSIKHLDLSINLISNIKSETFKKLGPIEILNLSNNNIKDDTVKILAKSTTIKELNLAWNDIGPRGAILLAANKSITTLNIYDNKITPKAIKAFARNTTLRDLTLGGFSKIYDHDVHPILLNNRTLWGVWICSRHISKELLDKIESHGRSNLIQHINKHEKPKILALMKCILPQIVTNIARYIELDPVEHTSAQEFAITLLSKHSYTIMTRYYKSIDKKQNKRNAQGISRKEGMQLATNKPNGSILAYFCNIFGALNE